MPERRRQAEKPPRRKKWDLDEVWVDTELGVPYRIKQRDEGFRVTTVYDYQSIKLICHNFHSKPSHPRPDIDSIRIQIPAQRIVEGIHEPREYAYSQHHSGDTLEFQRPDPKTHRRVPVSQDVLKEEVLAFLGEHAIGKHIISSRTALDLIDSNSQHS